MEKLVKMNNKTKVILYNIVVSPIIPFRFLCIYGGLIIQAIGNAIEEIGWMLPAMEHFEDENEEVQK
jgi:hypothetical protein